MRLVTILIMWLCLCGCISAFGQSNPLENPILLSHYTLDDLKEMKQQVPEKFDRIVYYYTASFYFLPIEGVEQAEVNPSHVVDISAYEGWRKEEEAVKVPLTKLGYYLVVLPERELTHPTLSTIKSINKAIR